MAPAKLSETHTDATVKKDIQDLTAKQKLMSVNQILVKMEQNVKISLVPIPANAQRDSKGRIAN